MLEQLLEEAETPASGTGHLEPVPGTVGLVAPAPAVVSLAPLAPAQVAPIAPPPAAPVSTEPEVDVAAMTIAVRNEPEDIDNTVMVSSSSATNCVLVLPDGSEYPLSTDAIVGRRPEASPHVQTLALPDATKSLSRTHARIWYDGTHWCLEDLGSVNGVSVFTEDNTERVLDAGVATPLMSTRFKLGTLEVTLAVPSA
ncbi:FHA domain-containing protein [Leucobacter komagatae]|uniref:FHA domain-containing protein n=1 Tax=Leucobacter komagatae TaxID=55969 RepID=A0A542Y6P9_9MICO|nr:FHA domain-containing protein [Leucobacter komagatae]TQL43715.1 FHA domain-containing protein [Leucobacter komagatae]